MRAFLILMVTAVTVFGATYGSIQGRKKDASRESEDYSVTVGKFRPEITSDSQVTLDFTDILPPPVECIEIGGVEVVIPQSLAVETQCVCADCLAGLTEEPLGYFIWKDGIATRFSKSEAIQVSHGRGLGVDFLIENAARLELTDDQVCEISSRFDHRSALDELAVHDTEFLDYGKASLSRDLRKQNSFGLSEVQLVRIEEKFDTRAARQRRGETVLPICCEKGICPTCK